MVYFSVLKHCILIGLCEVAKKFYMAIFGVVLHLSLSYQIPILVSYGNDSPKANVSSVKIQCETSLHKLAICRNLQKFKVLEDFSTVLYIDIFYLGLLGNDFTRGFFDIVNLYLKIRQAKFEIYWFG